jgi:glycosyltransferase 2 family protein
VLRVLVSAVLLIVVLAYADVGAVARALRDADWSWFLAALGLMAVAAVLGALRWRVLLHEAEVDVSRLRAVRTFAGALVLNNVLPTSVGGDALRTWLVGRESGRLVRAATATIVDKLTALFCLYVVAWATLAIDREAVPPSVVRAFTWVTIGLVAALVVAVLAAVGVRPIVRRLPERLRAMIRDTWVTLHTWGRSPRTIAIVVALGLAYQVLAVLVLILVGKTVGVELSFALAAVSTAIVLVAMLIPVSIGGLGVREGGYVLLLGKAGIDAADATSLSLLSAAVIVLSGAGVVAATAAWDAAQIRERRARALPRQPPA